MKILPTKKHISFVLIGLVIPFFVQAASFDCAKAASKVEKLICEDSGLSRADEGLAKAYKAAMEAVVDKEALKQQQRTWLKETRDKCQDIYCLNTTYENQTVALFKAEMQTKEAAGKIGKYIWKGDALNAIGDMISKPKDKSLCQAFRKNLNSFPSINPMVCDLKLNAELGFKPLDWKSLEVERYEGLIREIAKYNSRHNSFGLKKINDDAQWEKIFESIKSKQRLDYVTMDINGNGEKENLLHLYSERQEIKNCDVYKQVRSGRDGGQYFIADFELKHLINLQPGRKLESFQHASTGDFLTYENKLYFVVSFGKRLSEKDKYYSDVYLNEVPHPHDPMGFSERCMYRFIWP